MNVYDINIQWYSSGGLESKKQHRDRVNAVEAGREVLSKLSDQLARVAEDKQNPRIGFEMRCFFRSCPVILSSTPESLVNTCSPPKR